MMRLLLIFLAVPLQINCFGFNSENETLFTPESQGFIENCGQIKNQFHEPNTNLEFLWAKGNGMNVQLKSSGLSYDFFEMVDAERLQYRRLDMRFIGAHSNRQGHTSESSEEYYNFVSVKAENSTPGLQKHKSVRYNDIYNGVDLVVKANEDGNLKYDFYLNDFNSAEDILIEYRGFDSFELIDGQLSFCMGKGKVTERIPASWMSESLKPIKMEYQLVECDEDFVRLKILANSHVNSEDFKGKLTIDPVAEFTWGTYYGGMQMDKATAVATDTLGNMFIVGTSSSLNNIASEGSYQDQFAAGSSDAFLVRFNAHGLRQWATYYGGSGVDEGLSIDLDEHQNIYITGITNSIDSIAGDSLEYQQGPGGGGDGFLARFDRYGTMIWDTYIGGAGNDVASSCSANNLGQIVVGGYTDTPGFIENDSVQPLMPFSASIDGFLAEFNQDGQLVWSSYYGGIQNDFIEGVAFDSLANIIAIGTTESLEGIATGSAEQVELIGGIDGFIFKIDTLKNLSWGTYFGGVGTDKLTGIVAVTDDVYISGHTDDLINYSDTSSAQEFFGGERDGFVFKLYENGALHWFTYLGGEGDDVANDISTDNEGDIYIVGTTESDTIFGIDQTHLDSIQGQKDAFIAKFTPDGEDIWRTYHGGQENDFGNGIIVYGRTSVYIVGETESFQGISKDDPDQLAHQYLPSPGTYDGYLARFTQAASTDGDICPGGCCDCPGGGGGGSGGSNGGGGGSSEPAPIGICLGDSMLLQIHGGALGIGAEWVWYNNGCVTDAFFAEGDSIWVAPVVTTTYSVRYENVDDFGSCRSITIHVDTIPTAIATVQDSICMGSSFTVEGDGGYNYFWTTPSDSIFEIQNLVIDTATAEDEGIYQLVVHSQFGCVDTTEIEVIDFLPAPNFTSLVSDVLCNGGSDGSISLSSSDTIPISYFWPGLGSDSVFVDNLNSDGYLVIATNSFGCTSGDSIFVDEPPRLIDSVMVRPAYCDQANGAAEASLAAGSAPIQYQWSNGGSSNPMSDLLSGNYSLLVTDAIGCSDSANFFIDNLGFFDAIIEPDSIFLEFLETSSVEVYSSPETEELTYNWFPAEAVSCTDCPNPEINPPVSMMLYAEVTSSQGCFSSDSVYLHRSFPPPSSFIPSVFSPNGDGLNDELCVMGYRMIACDFHLYDKWGNEVFSTNDQSKCWDGTIDGVPANGIYIYTLEALLEEGESVSERGSIQILK